MRDLDDIARDKQAAFDERQAKSRARKDALHAQRELEQDRQEQFSELGRVAAQAFKQISRVEAQAQRALAQKIYGPDALRDVGRLFNKPGIRTAAGLSSQKAQKQTTRPQGKDGAVSFHFSVTSITKRGELAAVLKGQKSVAAAMSVATPHQRYIEREDAAERVPAVAMQAYIEDKDRAEQQKAEPLRDFEVSSFGNISNDAEGRARFWEVVEESEAKPSPAKVIIDPTVDQATWDNLRTILPQESSIPSILTLAMTTGKPVADTVSNADGLRLVQLFQKAGFTKFIARETEESDEVGPINFTLGRGGRVQTRLVVELPHEMSAQQRLTLAKEYCSTYESKGLRFWAVIHAPNKHNDSRNFHLHVNLYDRPTKQVPDPTGTPIWDFEHVEETIDKWRNKRSGRPFQQAKLREVATIDWVKKERDRFSKLANAHLATAGIAKRLDPRRYEDMGVQDKARDRIAPASYARERKGLETKDGVALATKQWAANRDAVAAIAKADASYEAYRRAWLAQSLQPQLQRKTAEAVVARSTGIEVARLSAKKAALVNERNAYSHVAAKLESRARLRPKRQRDETDEAAITVAAELSSKVSDIDQRIALLITSIKKAERRLIKVKRLDDAAIATERLKDLQRRMRSMSATLMADTVVDTQAPMKAESQPAPENQASTASVDPLHVSPEKQRASDLLTRVRERAREIAQERAESAGSTPSWRPARVAPAVPPPVSSAIEPRPLTKDPQLGTPIAANPIRPEQQAEAEDEAIRKQREADELAALQRRLAIARQLGGRSR
ncbi:MAG: MobA/MobL family protein [Kaiparowitsia implicata GSE-PSE-MK54-09C]|jgi:phosphohistidine swiveling domain-containing protein|nr:MobA/MobL family protein [Kaiparowitsia implicata GSE-PSE-MK54-09C]